MQLYSSFPTSAFIFLFYSSPLGKKVNRKRKKKRLNVERKTKREGRKGMAKGEEEIRGGPKRG